jgi:hypothetical protein
MTDTRIVTSTYRYKRPPRKRKAAPLEPLEGPVIIVGKRSRRQDGAAMTAAKVSLDYPAITTGHRNQAHCGRQNVNPP